MQTGSRISLATLAFVPFVSLALLSGCGESVPETGTQIKEPPEAKAANNAMLDSVKAKAAEKKK